MKLVKRTITLALTVVLLMSVLAISASADTLLDLEWRSYFATYFPPQRTNSYSTGYTGAIQRFLYCRPSTRTDITLGGGVDGVYGNYTASAVETFQGEYNADFVADIDTDGKVGPQTWSAIASYLKSEPVSDYAQWRMNSSPVIKYYYDSYYGEYRLAYYKTNTSVVYFHSVR